MEMPSGVHDRNRSEGAKPLTVGRRSQNVTKSSLGDRFIANSMVLLRFVAWVAVAFAWQTQYFIEACLDWRVAST